MYIDSYYLVWMYNFINIQWEIKVIIIKYSIDECVVVKSCFILYLTSIISEYER